MNRYAILICLIGFLPALGHAGVQVTTISQLGAATAEYAMIIVENPIPIRPECALDNYILSFDKTTQHGRDMFSLALTALTAGKKLRIEYSETSCGLWGTRTLVGRIDIFAN